MGLSQRLALDRQPVVGARVADAKRALPERILGPPWPLSAAGWMAAQSGYLERIFQVVSGGGQRRWSPVGGSCNLIRFIRLRRHIEVGTRQSSSTGRAVRWPFADRTKRPTPRVVLPVLAVTCTCSDNNRPPPNRRWIPVVAVIDPKRAYLSAHPPCAPGKVSVTRLLAEQAKPQKTMEFQVPRFELAVPRFTSDATRWRRGAPCCGVWCRDDWILGPPPRARRAEDIPQGRRRSGATAATSAQLRRSPSRVARAHPEWSGGDARGGFCRFCRLASRRISRDIMPSGSNPATGPASLGKLPSRWWLNRTSGRSSWRSRRLTPWPAASPGPASNLAPTSAHLRRFLSCWYQRHFGIVRCPNEAAQRDLHQFLRHILSLVHRHPPDARQAVVGDGPVPATRIQPFK